MGDDLTIDDRSATPLALLFHELATNASKYGALSIEDGWVTLQIDRQGDACLIQWHEHGGPPIMRLPEARGFGSRLIELSIGGQLQGSIDEQWEPDGLQARISIPLESLARQSRPEFVLFFG